MRITVGVELIDREPPYENDVCIMDAYIDYIYTILTDDCKLNLKQYVSGTTDEFIPELILAREKATLLRKRLHSHDLVWVSDMTVPRRAPVSEKERNKEIVSNRTLSRQFATKYNPTMQNAWVRELLAGIPGLFTTALDCDFILGTPAGDLVESRHAMSRLRH